MPRVRCFYEGCVHLEGEYCVAEKIVLNPEDGCLTFTQIEDLALDDEDWEEDLFGKVDKAASLLDDNDDDDGYDPDEWN